MRDKGTSGERRDQRTDEIVDVAARLFARNGYAATGVSELCDAVELGRGALYYYIGSKEALLVRIHDRVAELQLPRGREIVAMDVSPVEKLRLLGEATIGIITDIPDHCFVFLHEWRSLTGDAAVRYREQRREYEAIVASVLREGEAQGVFRFDDIRLTIIAWFSLHNYTYHWYRPGGRYEPSTIAASFFQTFLHGVVVPGALAAPAAPAAKAAKAAPKAAARARRTPS